MKTVEPFEVNRRSHRQRIHSNRKTPKVKRRFRKFFIFLFSPRFPYPRLVRSSILLDANRRASPFFLPFFSLPFLFSTLRSRGRFLRLSFQFFVLADIFRENPSRAFRRGFISRFLS